jgi:hypothetical protein
MIIKEELTVTISIDDIIEYLFEEDEFPLRKLFEKDGMKTLIRVIERYYENSLGYHKAEAFCATQHIEEVAKEVVNELVRKMLLMTVGKEDHEKDFQSEPYRFSTKY